MGRPALRDTSITDRALGARRAVAQGANPYDMLSLVVWPDSEESFFQWLIDTLPDPRPDLRDDVPVFGEEPRAGYCKAYVTSGRVWYGAALCSRRATMGEFCLTHFKRVQAGLPQPVAA